MNLEKQEIQFNIVQMCKCEPESLWDHSAMFVGLSLLACLYSQPFPSGD